MQQLHLEKAASLFLYTKLKAKSRFKKERKKTQHCKTTAYSGLTAAYYGAVAINHHSVWPWSSAEVEVEDTTFLGAVMKSPVQSFQGSHEQERDRLQEAKC